MVKGKLYEGNGKNAEPTRWSNETDAGDGTPCSLLSFIAGFDSQPHCIYYCFARSLVVEQIRIVGETTREIANKTNSESNEFCLEKVTSI